MTELRERQEFGSFAAIAALCGVSRESVRKWLRVPALYAHLIESATNGAVRCEDLRDDVEWIRDRKGKVIAYSTRVTTPETKAA